MNIENEFQDKTAPHREVKRQFTEKTGVVKAPEYKPSGEQEYLQEKSKSSPSMYIRPDDSISGVQEQRVSSNKEDEGLYQAKGVEAPPAYHTPGPLPPVASLPSFRDVSSSTDKQYVYGYGIKNIGVEHSTFGDKGIFVSKPMEIEGNVIEVSLLANEVHPIFDTLSGKATDRMTSVEYYLAYDENPSLNDWHPVLPEGQTDIKCERLFFQGLTAVLRFHAKINEPTKTFIYKNGIKMQADKWCFVERGASIQLLEPRDLTAIYTIDYIPDTIFVNPWSINVKEKGAKRVRQIDRFEKGTAYNKNVTLSKYPFIDYDYINAKTTFDSNKDDYRPFEVYLRNGEIAVGNGVNVDTVFPEKHAQAGQPFTLNRTDYKEDTDMKLRPYSTATGKEYRGFEYKQYRNKLIFSETFNRADIHTNVQIAHGNAEIEVQYEYLITKFRLKIILRKNTGNEIIVSPKVNDYQVKFKIMK